MNIALIVLLTAAGTALFMWLFSRMFGKKGRETDSSSSLLLIQHQLQELRGAMDQKLGDSTKMFQHQFTESMGIVKDVTEKLTKLDETNKQVLTFSEHLEHLQDLLKNPKQRGILGEYYLETILKSAFPPKQYQMQYKFQDGAIVDAALFFGDKIIPIDSKFSLENYNRITEEKDPARREQLEIAFKQDLKNRIDETSKYIRPQENTVEFAFMFIPAEGIYYDLLVNQIGTLKSNTRDLIDYAIHDKKVHIVSPTTFYVTLQALIHGMRAYQIQESTKTILKNVGQLEKHLGSYQEYLVKLGGHLGTAVNAYTLASREFAKVDKDILKITGSSNGVEIIRIEKPVLEEE